MLTDVLKVDFEGNEIAYRVNLHNGAVFLVDRRDKPMEQAEEERFLSAIRDSRQCPINPDSVAWN